MPRLERFVLAHGRDRHMRGRAGLGLPRRLSGPARWRGLAQRTRLAWRRLAALRRLARHAQRRRLEPGLHPVELWDIGGDRRIGLARRLRGLRGLLAEVLGL